MGKISSTSPTNCAYNPPNNPPSYNIASMSVGPFLRSACLNAPANCVGVEHCDAKTPKPFATATHSTCGFVREVRRTDAFSCGLGRLECGRPADAAPPPPGPPVRVFCIKDSSSRIWYLRLAHTIVMTFKFSFACVQSAGPMKPESVSLS